MSPPDDNRQSILRLTRSKEELEAIVLQHLRARPETAGVESVTVRPASGAKGGWTVKAFQEGTSSRGGCLQALHRILPGLQKQFVLGT